MKCRKFGLNSRHPHHRKKYVACPKQKLAVPGQVDFFRPSTIDHRPSTIDHRPSPIAHRPSPISHQPSVTLRARRARRAGHSRTIDTKTTDVVSQDIEEERRLFYVGVTRAKDQLVLSRCKARGMRGKAVARTPSRFLADIPEERVREIEVTGPPQMAPDEVAASANALLAALDALGE